MDRDTASVCGSGRIGEMICDAISDTTIRCAYRLVCLKFWDLGFVETKFLLFLLLRITVC